VVSTSITTATVALTAAVVAFLIVRCVTLRDSGIGRLVVGLGVDTHERTISSRKL
jgi:hypothetical protein